MMSAEDNMAALGVRCREVGLKATRQRTEIYRELASTEAHPDAETIYRRVKRRIPAISFDTVYRTLRTFEEKGLISRVGTPLERSRFDANMGRHHHFVCAECGLVRDFQCAAFDRLAAPEDACRFGVPGSVHVEVRGVCAACSRKTDGGVESETGANAEAGT